MTFNQWLRKNKKHVDQRVSGFAREALRDSCWPKTIESFEDAHLHLVHAHHVHPGSFSHRCLVVCWGQYLKDRSSRG